MTSPTRIKHEHWPPREEAWKDLTLFNLLERAGTQYPDKIGLVTPGESYTYSRLLDQVRCTAQSLLEAGVGPEDRVATLFDTRGEWVILNLAVCCLGGIMVPLNMRLQAQELRQELRTAQASVLITLDRHKEHDLLERIANACPDMISVGGGRIQSASLPDLRMTFCFSPQNNRIDPPYGDFREVLDTTGLGEYESIQHYTTAIDPEDTLLIMFTSGSTGASKGVMLSHRSIIGQAFHLNQLLTMGPTDRYLNLLPFFHIAGYVQGIVLNLFAGSSLHLLDTFDAQEAVSRIEQDEITVLAAMPITTQRFLDYASLTGIELKTLEKVHAVDAVFCERYRQQSGATLFTAAYGLTESALGVSAGVLKEKHQKTRTGYVGYPFSGISVIILDLKTREEVPPNSIGEIAFKGWNLLQGYLGDTRPEESLFDKQGHFLTGDLGYMDQDGALYFLGRSKEMVKTGGENVSQLEVENFLQENVPGVKSSYVIGVPDQLWGEVVTAVIEPVVDFEVNSELVRTHCAGKIASFKIPRYVLPMPRAGWPLKASGKVDKRELRQWAMEQVGFACDS